jgi:hypothetical protein
MARAGARNVERLLLATDQVTHLLALDQPALDNLIRFRDNHTLSPPANALAGELPFPVCHAFIIGSLNLREVKRGLYHVRSTLQHLFLSYEVYAGESAEPRGLTGVSEHSLGSLREYEQLTMLSVSLALVFGEIRPGQTPPLVDRVPPHLKKSTVREDLWDYEVFHGWQRQDIKVVFEAFIRTRKGGARRLRRSWSIWSLICRRYGGQWVVIGATRTSRLMLLICSKLGASSVQYCNRLNSLPTRSNSLTGVCGYCNST